jgi:hypothetical protein
VLYYAATQWWNGGPAAPWTNAIASDGRPTRLVLIGAGLFLIGWLGNVTIGFWFLQAGAEVIFQKNLLTGVEYLWPRAEAQ